MVKHLSFLIFLFIHAIAAGVVHAQPVAQKVFDRVRPFVFQVKTAIAPDAPKASYGSAWVLDRKGLLITNYHVVSSVIQKEEKYNLFLIEGEKTYPAEILDIDIPHDLALIRVARTFPSAVPLAPSMPGQGDKIFSIGLPLDLNMAITEGNYNGMVKYGVYELIHMASPLNGGMSGGPTVNSKGQVVGVNVSVLVQSQNVSFSVPVKFVKEMRDRHRARAQNSSEQIDFHRSIQSQLLEVQESLIAGLRENEADSLSLPGWKVVKPPEILKCWSTNRDDREKYYNSVKQTCYLNHVAFLSGSIRSGSYEISYRTISNVETEKRIHQSQKFRLLDQIYNRRDKFRSLFLRSFSRKRQELTRFDCNEQVLQNEKGVSFVLNYCLRGYLHYPKIFDVEMKFVTVNKGDHNLIGRAGFTGFSKENIQWFLQSWLKRIEPEESPS